MMLCELATAALQKVPVKILIINNSYLGMIRQWQELFFDNRLSGADLEGNPDFVKLAGAYGVPGRRVKPHTHTHTHTHTGEHNDIQERYTLNITRASFN